MKKRESVDYEHYRVVLRDEVERFTLRRVAARLGMSPSGLQMFLKGTRPCGKTREKLRIWWYTEFGFDNIPVRDATMLVRRMVRGLPDPGRAVGRILDVVEVAHTDEGVAPPTWIRAVRQALSQEPVS